MSDLSKRIRGLSPEQLKLLTKRVGQQKKDSAPEAIRPRERGASALPLSFAQERLWFIDQLLPGSALYTIPLAVRLTGALDVAALTHSLRTVVQRHECLRTTFRLVDGRPVQDVAPAQEVSLPLTDLRALAPEARSATVTRHTQDFALQPFDLKQGPLLRSCLLRLSEDSHLWLLSLHHIVADGWSLGVLVQEVATLYTAALRGQPDALSPLPIQYADYALWQREWLQGPARKPLLDYWTRQLADAPTVLELPTDFPRPSVATTRGALHPFQLSAELTASLNAFSREEGATLFMTLMAAFQSLLQRYCAKDDFIVGTPIANRTRSETEALIGCFINTLPIRANLSARPSFRELLRRVQSTCLEAYAHQELPFEHLVDALHLSRDLSHAPLIQVLFILQNAPLRSLALPGVTLDVEGTDTVTAKFDLTLSLQETGDAIRGFLEYNTDLFAPETIARLAEQFATLLTGAIASPDARISELPVLTTDERQRLLVDLNATATPYPLDSSLPALFFAQAARSPDASALFTSESQLSFRALSERVARLSHHLRHLGVGPELTVGVFLHRSDDLVTALLAILCAGGTYVPLDPAYPPERLVLMLEDSRASLVLTHSALAPRLPSGSHRALCLDAVAEDVASRPSSPPPLSLFPDNLAYLIYTSGSTGRPKAVAISHRSALAMLFWARDCFSPEERSGVLASTSICFDLSVFELFLPLCFGGCVVLADNALHLPSHPAASHVSLLNTVPSALSELLRGAGLPPSVRTINLAGEPLPRALVTRAYQVPSVQRLFNLYGPSEDTTYSTWALIDPEETGTPPIGRAISNSQVYLLDRFGQPTPFGVPGEVFLGGEGLARGYLGQPALTAERFVPNPFSSAPGARLYRTGDLARWRPDGQLEFLGRNDHQVKLRGFRIELGEIEAALARQPGVREVAVLVREDVPGDKRLVAYLVLAPDAPSVSDLRRALQQQLPGYMVPAHLLPLDALPLTPNGKLDRRALPTPDARPSLDTGFVAPQSALEQQLASIWQSVLRLDKVGVHDNFFDLGGNSLLMVQLHAQLREDPKLDIPLVELFRAPTIRSLAKLLSRDVSEQPSLEKHQERATKQKQVMDQQKRLLMRMKEGKKNG